jgi:hypothetical protein
MRSILAAMSSKCSDALTDLCALKSLQAVKVSSNSVELYEIIFGADKIPLREVVIGKERMCE